jgi:hypothetical protein
MRVTSERTNPIQTRHPRARSGTRAPSSAHHTACSCIDASWIKVFGFGFWFWILVFGSTHSLLLVLVHAFVTFGFPRTRYFLGFGFHALVTFDCSPRTLSVNSLITEYQIFSFIAEKPVSILKFQFCNTMNEIQFKMPKIGFLQTCTQLYR